MTSASPILTYNCTCTMKFSLRKHRLMFVVLLTYLGLIQFDSNAPLVAQTPEPQTLISPKDDPSTPTTIKRKLVIVTGAPGEEAYTSAFRNWSERWVNSGRESGVICEWIDGTQPFETSASPSSVSDKKRLLDWIAAAGDSELWIVMIGHGTFDGTTAKFNLRGEDISGNELADALAPLKGPQVLVHCFSCSGAFLPLLSRPGRIVITATKSGAEMNYSRFGDYLSLTLSDPSSDLDHDNAVSILEAFLMASKRTEQFYLDDKRLVTEHPLLDDSGDGKGVGSAFFRGIRLIKRASDGATVDGDFAVRTLLKPSTDDAPLTELQLKKRDELELALSRLRLAKPSMSEDEYYAQLANIADGLAEVYGFQPTESAGQ